MQQPCCCSPQVLQYVRREALRCQGSEPTNSTRYGLSTCVILDRHSSKSAPGAQNFADELSESAAQPIAARVAHARLQEALTTVDCPTATVQACLAAALGSIPPASASRPRTGGPDALPPVPRDWSVRVLDALLHHLLRHPDSADLFLSPPDAASAAPKLHRSKLTRLASAVRRSSKDSKAVLEAGVHPLARLALRAAMCREHSQDHLSACCGLLE